MMCVGPLKRVCSWGPLVTVIVVKTVSLTTVYCLSMWWPPSDSPGGFANAAVFALFTGLVLYNFLSAMLVGPGFVPLNWKPENSEDEQYLQYCSECKGFKAPRAHHCRKCERCVMKMDHHCPWINTCCGHKNHANFIWFLIFAICGCLHASIIIIGTLYTAIYRSWNRYYRVNPYIHLEVNGFLTCIFALGLALGVTASISALLFIQMRFILRNRTGIEGWIVMKADRPRPDGERFVYPYDLGPKKNLKFVFCRKEEFDDDDGIIWPVKDGCNQYTLTIEQIQQKEEKKRQMKEYTIVEEYGGSWCPITKGMKVLFRPPCSSESRIPISVGSKVMVSRWNKFWLYGDIQAPMCTESKRTRGWFPRRCAVEIINGNDESHLKVQESLSKKNE